MLDPIKVPLSVIVEGSVVMVEGPGGIAFALTIDAAAETSDLLLEASCVAQGNALRPGLPQPT